MSLSAIIENKLTKQSVLFFFFNLFSKSSIFPSSYCQVIKMNNIFQKKILFTIRYSFTGMKQFIRSANNLLKNTNYL